MPRYQSDLIIYGDGLGACAAALAACRQGVTPILIKKYQWFGGQLTSQMVPPDEHPWIERFGCTASYRSLREAIRNYYRSLPCLRAQAKDDPLLNPGRCWVSRLGHEPWVAASILDEMISSAGVRIVEVPRLPVSASVKARRLLEVSISDVIIEGRYWIDASETGDLLPASETAYRLGAEGKVETSEPHASDCTNPLAQQAITWCFTITNSGEGDLADPSIIEGFRSPEWPGYPGLPLFGWSFPSPATGETKTLSVEEGEFSLFSYRRILDGALFDPPLGSLSVVNWPQNDFFIEPLLDHPVHTEEEVGALAKRFSEQWLAWLQTEGGHPNLRLHRWAEAPYVRESRRIVACKTVVEQDVASEVHPGSDRAPSFDDSVGVGAYRIDLHPRCDGSGSLDLSSLPFEIPLGSLIPLETKNLIAGAKNIGTTHITNGCYRLHPVEWNIGEAAGILASYCLRKGLEPHDAWSETEHLRALQGLCEDSGIERRWPDEALGAL